MTLHAVAPPTSPAPVVDRPAASPVDLVGLSEVLTRELRAQRHGSPVTVCWGCPRDAAGLASAVDRAARAGLL